MVLGVKMAEIFEKNTKKRILKNTKNAHRIRKNEKFKNRASSCSNQAQMTPWAKISWSWDFWWLRKTWTDRHTDRQTRFMFYKYRSVYLSLPSHTHTLGRCLTQLLHSTPDKAAPPGDPANACRRSVRRQRVKRDRFVLLQYNISLHRRADLSDWITSQPRRDWWNITSLTYHHII